MGGGGGGYVLHKLHIKFARKSLPENQQAMAILKAGKLEKLKSWCQLEIGEVYGL